MSNWPVIYSPEFKQEVRDIHMYIANSLLAPQAALGQTDRILSVAEGLGHLPFKHPEYEKEPWKSRGIRKVPVDNYIIFYYPNEERQEVVVLHVFYGGRNIEKILPKDSEY